VLKFIILLFRYFVRLSYKGTHYNGWQIQPGVKTIQEVLNQKLSLLLKEEIYTVGAGRTDTGVHATCFYAHFDSDNPFIDSEKEKLLYHINCILPLDISVYDIFKVKKEAHSRFSALSRTYHYRIARTKNPFTTESAWYYHKPLDLKMMNIASQVLFEYKDFTSFSKLHTDVKTNNCAIKEAYWMEQNEEFIFTIKADRFLRNMVRAIVGTLLQVGSGKLSIDELRKVIEKKDRSAAGISVDARGLYLVDIEYPMEIFLK
jgi:tRNA pseudouridine38-40 synthase